MLLLDWTTGTLRALLTHTNNSAAGKQGVVKSIEYCSLLLIGWLLGMIGGPILQYAPIITCTMVGVTEATSFFENVRDISRHFGVAENRLVSLFIKLGRLNPPEGLLRAVIQAATGYTGPLKVEGGLDAQEPDGASPASTQPHPEEEGGQDVDDPRRV